jgi:hypothetical protein
VTRQKDLKHAASITSAAAIMDHLKLCDWKIERPTSSGWSRARLRAGYATRPSGIL